MSLKDRLLRRKTAVHRIVYAKCDEKMQPILSEVKMETIIGSVNAWVRSKSDIRILLIEREGSK